MTSRVLVVAATSVEARYVPPGLPVLVTGVGKTAAAAATAAALARDPDPASLLVVNLGSAGALRPGLSGLHEPSRVLNHDLSAAALRALGVPVEDELTVDGGDGSVLATGDLFVSDTSVRDRLAERADLVDMEGFAVAWACRAAGARVRLLKHVSDEADERAVEWASVVDVSARALAERLVRLTG